jgi:Spy/CpxP family protein refolding chaperone
MDELNATPDQRQRVLGIADGVVDDAIEFHGKHRATGLEVLDAWKAETPDEARLRALVDRQAEDFRSFAQRMASALLEVHGVLDAGQRQMLVDKLQAHMAAR